MGVGMDQLMSTFSRDDLMKNDKTVNDFAVELEARANG